MEFSLECKDKNTNARAGTIKTDRGEIETPIFMPVGTLGTVRGLHNKDLEEEVKPQIILSNTYHLYFRPGIDVLSELGGLHNFISWNKPILTDSGGYQVYSLSSSRKITNNGVNFKSYIDGSNHFFTPEFAIDIQRSIGADIIMAFDICDDYPCDKYVLKKTLKLTHEWALRCNKRFKNTKPNYNFSQSMFPIVQGGCEKDLRRESANFISSLDCDGNAIGGLSVGEPKEQMYEMTNEVCNILPTNKPRYLMGVGKPENILECISLGIDMFDCVMPTRNARNGMMFTIDGTINIKNKKWERDDSPLDRGNYCFVDLMYSKSYLRHLFMSNEFLGKQILSIHNLSFYIWLSKQARLKIKSGDFYKWKENMLKSLNNRI